MGLVQTAVAAVTDTRTYYNCPRCGKRVWAYGVFAGNVCLRCEGTLRDAASRAAGLVVESAVLLS